MAYGINWDSAWTTIVSGQSVSASSPWLSSGLSLSGKIACLISVEATFPAGASNPLVVSILKDLDGTNYQGAGDMITDYNIAERDGASNSRVFSLDAMSLDGFKLRLSTDESSAITATVRIKYAVADTAA